jgi:hypothetical protein
MRRGARIAANVFSLGIFPLVGFVRKIVQNRQAVKAGKPRPYTPGELVMEALEMGGNAALPAVRRDKVREGIERGLEMLEAADTDATPREKPPTHRGLK